MGLGYKGIWEIRGIKVFGIYGKIVNKLIDEF
jgi:hypothetical protein